jgi:heme/copper-type cytochrome/quinol oxidase subunit 3
MNIKMDADGMNIHIPSTTKEEEERLKTEERKRNDRYHARILEIADSATFAVLLLVYILLSVCMPKGWTAPSGLGAWACFWPILLLGDLPASIIRCVYDKKFGEFAIWGVATFAYTFLGMFAGMWHPYWVILLIIPVYYSVFSPIDHLRSDKESGRI